MSVGGQIYCAIATVSWILSCMPNPRYDTKIGDGRIPSDVINAERNEYYIFIAIHAPNSKCPR